MAAELEKSLQSDCRDSVIAGAVYSAARADGTDDAGIDVMLCLSALVFGVSFANLLALMPRSVLHVVMEPAFAVHQLISKTAGLMPGFWPVRAALVDDLWPAPPVCLDISDKVAIARTERERGISITIYDLERLLRLTCLSIRLVRSRN